MSIGILYESEEWSNTRLHELILQSGTNCELVFMADESRIPDVSFQMVVNRVFPSAAMRDHHHALQNTFDFLARLKTAGIPVINSSSSFEFECSKRRTYQRLQQSGFRLPEWRSLLPGEKTIESWNRYPAVIKPDCGGRSFNTRIVQSRTELETFLSTTEGNEWILQEYIHPHNDFTTRIEIVGGKVLLTLKRFLGQGNISSYSRTSRYELYKDCPAQFMEESAAILNLLKIEMGGLDFIESINRVHYPIDVNSTSNFTPDLIPLYGFDPMEKMAAYIVSRYREIC